VYAHSFQLLGLLQCHVRPPPPFPQTSPGGVGKSSQPLPRVVPTTAYHRGIFEAAEARRQQRLAHRALLRSDPVKAAEEAECMLAPITHRDGSPTLAPAMRVGSRIPFP
jgi:hypothetical protein